MADVLDDFTLFGHTVSSVLRNPRWAASRRALAGVEIWAGTKAVSRSAAKNGLKFATIEIEDDAAEQDLTTQIGFEYGVSCLMAVAEGGLAVMAPACSSFVWASSSRCRRLLENDYEGDTTYGPVVQGNIMAKVAAFYMLLAIARRLFTFWEQPAGSHMFKLAACRAALEYASRVCGLREGLCDHCRFSRKPLGLRHKKPFRLLTTGPQRDWAAPLELRCRCRGKGHVALMSKDVNGKESGNKYMRASQAYSALFGGAIIAAWLKCTGLRTPSTEAERAGARSRSPARVVASDCWRDRSGTSARPGMLQRSRVAPAAAVSSPASWRDRTATLSCSLATPAAAAAADWRNRSSSSSAGWSQRG